MTDIPEPTAWGPGPGGRWSDDADDPGPVQDDEPRLTPDDWTAGPAEDEWWKKGCPHCGHELDVHFHGGVSCPSCGWEGDMLGDTMVGGRPSEATGELWPDTIPWGEAEQDFYRNSFTVVAGSVPATYTAEDPYDVAGKRPFYEGMHVEWWKEPRERQVQAVVNALRATMVSPRLSLKNNAAVYQALMAVPPRESDPDVFVQAVKDYKARNDARGQTQIGQDPEDVLPHADVGRLAPGFWTNIKRLAAIGPMADELTDAAVDDITHGGTGQEWRQKVLQLAVPGVGPKVASFAWLALAPLKSELGTVDVWMMRDLGRPEMAPRNYEEYIDAENALKQRRDAEYPGLPLGAYQWAAWDKVRTPGWHQDHSPLRVLDPVPWEQVQWREQSPPSRPRQVAPQQQGQMALVAKYESLSDRCYNRLVENGGFTVKPNGRLPRPGYYVSEDDFERVMPMDSLTPTALKSFFEVTAPSVNGRDAFYGGWVTPRGDVHLDVSLVYDGLGDALQKARETGQLAIWDGFLNREVRLDDPNLE